jgi:hypothetical protein
MKPLIVHLSNIHNSNFTLNGDLHVNMGNPDARLVELILQCIEINRRLIAGIHADWENEEDLYSEIQQLIEQQKLLEIQIADHLNP